MWQNWVNLLAGIWLIISPYVGFTSSAMTANLIITGAIVGILSLWAGLATNRGMSQVAR
jgi:hypothetical protein